MGAGSRCIRASNLLTPQTRRYNNAVLSPEQEKDSAHRHHRHATYASEATGLLLIAFVLLILTLVRYWQNIHWSLR